MQGRVNGVSWKQLAKKLGRTNKTVLISIAVIVVGVAVIMAIDGVTKQQSAIKAFRMSEGSELPKLGELERTATVEADKQLHVLARYDAVKLESARIKLLDSAGKQVFDTSLFQLSDQGTFSVSINPKTLTPGDYKVELLDQKDNMMLEGALNVMEKKQ